MASCPGSITSPGEQSFSHPVLKLSHSVISSLFSPTNHCVVKRILAEVCRLVESVVNSDPDRGWKPPPLLEEELVLTISALIDDFCQFCACAVYGVRRFS